jgi:hypothetical protein
MRMRPALITAVQRGETTLYLIEQVEDFSTLQDIMSVRLELKYRRKRPHIPPGRPRDTWSCSPNIMAIPKQHLTTSIALFSLPKTSEFCKFRPVKYDSKYSYVPMEAQSLPKQTRKRFLSQEEYNLRVDFFTGNYKEAPKQFVVDTNHKYAFVEGKLYKRKPKTGLLFEYVPPLEVHNKIAAIHKDLLCHSGWHRTFGAVCTPPL